MAQSDDGEFLVTGRKAAVVGVEEVGVRDERVTKPTGKQVSFALEILLRFAPHVSYVCMVLQNDSKPSQNSERQKKRACSNSPAFRDSIIIHILASIPFFSPKGAY